MTNELTTRTNPAASTINPALVPPPPAENAEVAAAIAAPAPDDTAAAKTNPGMAVQTKAHGDDLEGRIATRKQQLIDKMLALQSNGEAGSVVAHDHIKAQLSELAHIVKEGVVDGWSSINAATRSKLDRWLAA